MGTFAGFLASSVRDEIVVVELTPRLVLSGFSATGGLSNTYETALTRFELAGDVPGGVYRRCVGVRENGTNLTKLASAAAVDAAPGSWWWDEANETLYVHSTTGSDPDTFTAYQALIRFYFATKPAVLNLVDGDPDTGIYHLPWLIGDLPELAEYDNYRIFGAKISQGGDIAFLNGQGFWNYVTAHDGPYRWKNAGVEFSLGGGYGDEVLLRSQYSAMMSYLVEDIAAEESETRASIAPLAHRLNESIPKTPYFADANLGDGVEGTKKWIGYGRTTMRPDLTDTSSHGVYTIADSAVQTLFAVNSATAINKSSGARQALTLTTDYTVNLTACTITIVNATYKWEDYLIEIDVTGKPDGAGSYFKTFGDVVKDMLQTFLGVRGEELDSPSFAQAAIDAPEEVAVWVKSPRTIASILATAENDLPALEQSFRGLIAQTKDGLWRADIWDPNYDPTALDTFRKSEFVSFAPQPTLKSIFSKVQIFYNYNHSTGAWSVEEASDTTQEYLHDSTDVLQVYTFLRESGDAQILAQRWLAVAGGQVLELEFEELAVRLAAHQVRDRILVDYDPAPVAAEFLSSSPFELLELRRSLSPMLMVSGRLGNLRGIGQFIGRWTDASAPDWSTATDSEKAVSGFWSDPNGFISPGNPPTKNIRKWW